MKELILLIVWLCALPTCTVAAAKPMASGRPIIFSVNCGMGGCGYYEILKSIPKTVKPGDDVEGMVEPGEVLYRHVTYRRTALDEHNVRRVSNGWADVYCLDKTGFTSVTWDWD